MRHIWVTVTLQEISLVISPMTGKFHFFDSRALTIPVSLLNFLKELKRETKNGEQAREKITDRTKV